MTGRGEKKIKNKISITSANPGSLVRKTNIEKRDDVIYGQSPHYIRSVFIKKTEWVDNPKGWRTLNLFVVLMKPQWKNH